MPRNNQLGKNPPETWGEWFEGPKGAITAMTLATLLLTVGAGVTIRQIMQHEVPPAKPKIDPPPNPFAANKTDKEKLKDILLPIEQNKGRENIVPDNNGILDARNTETAIKIIRIKKLEIILNLQSKKSERFIIDDDGIRYRISERHGVIEVREGQRVRIKFNLDTPHVVSIHNGKDGILAD